MYDFNNLSPIDFEELVRDLLQEVLGVRMESFKVGKDFGIDFRFSVATNHKCIIQAKHYLKSGANALVSSAKKENEKVKKLKPDRYLFVTSLPMSSALKERIVTALPDAPLAIEDVIGQEDLNAFLKKFPSIERNHFKLWLGSTAVLEKLLNSGIYNRTETEIMLINEMIPRFVQNDSVKEAEKILERDGTLIIAGDPGVGKTTLARMLLSLHIAQGWQPFVVSDMEEAFKIATKGEKKLIFFDDFLGQVRLTPDYVRGLDQRLPPFLCRVNANKDLRFILTTREIILNQAELLSAKIASKNIVEKKYILDVGKYTREVKARILYNHLYFSNLKMDEIGSLICDDFFLKIIDHHNFNPRLIDILTSGEYQMVSGQPLKDAMSRILANPEELWARPYRDHISSDGRALMLALLFNASSVDLATLRTTFSRVSAAIDPLFALAQAQTRFQASLKELEGAVVAIAGRMARFSNPGLRDFLQAAVLEDGVLFEIVGQSESYDEIKQAWTIYYGQTPRPSASLDYARVWLGALERMLDGAPSRPIDRLELILEILDLYHEDQGLLNAVRVAKKQIEYSHFGSEDVSKANRFLEGASLHLIPSDLQDELISTATEVACQILEGQAEYLILDEIVSLYDALTSYGSDLERSKAAAQLALDAFLPELDNDLYNLSTVDELDEYEKDLKKFFKRTSYSGDAPEKKMRSKRESLEEKEWERRDESYFSGSTRSEMLNASSEAIRSIFYSLRDSKE